jgi:hypothetical protein
MNEKHQIVVDDPDVVANKIKDLVGEGKTVFEHLLSLIHDELDAISKIEESVTVIQLLNQSTIRLGARFHSAAQAGLMLISTGQIVPSLTMSRDMAEILSLLRFLHKHPKEATNFMKSTSLKERKRFSLQKVYKSIPEGQRYKDQFDLASSMVHPSSIALGANFRPEPSGEVSVFIGPFYQPYSIAIEFQTEIASSFEAVWLLDSWYKESPSWPVKTSDLLILRKAMLEYLIQLRNKAEEQDAQLEVTLKYIKGKSPEQIEAIWKKIDKRD